MLDALHDWWAQIVGGTAVSTVLGWIGIDTVKTVRRHEREKADKTEVAALATRVDQSVTAITDKMDRSYSDLLTRIDTREDALLARIDQSNAEASKKRGEMYAKIDTLNTTVSRFMGQQNGRRDGG